MLQLYPKGNEADWLRSFAFSVEIRPRYCETDGLAHVSNVVYPIYLEQSRLKYLQAAGDPEPGPYAFTHVTGDFHLRYIAPCYYDEPLRVASKLVSLGRSSAVMEQAIVGADDDSIRAIARVVIVRSDGQRSLAWSDAQRAVLRAFEPGIAVDGQPHGRHPTGTA